MENKLVSVIIPTYKRPKKLKRALKSVIEQTYKNLEIIVVNDDPNTDIRNHLPDDDRITPINHEENKGSPAAKNSGIRIAKGEYLAFLDDDDIWKKDKIQLQVKKMEESNENYGMVYTGYHLLKDGEVIKTFIPEKEGWIHEYLLTHDIIPAMLPLVKKECFEKVGLYDPEYKNRQDKDFYLRVSKNYKVGMVQKSLMYYCVTGEDRMGKNAYWNYEGNKRLLKMHYDDYKKCPEGMSKLYKKMGSALWRLDYNNKLAAKYYKKAFLLNKKDIFSLFGYFLMKLPVKIKKIFLKTGRNIFKNMDI